jgi:ABC-type Zn uptake system ZnuABC Zn-binding protein ZnuA
MEKFENLKALIANIEEDVKKFDEKGNKSAGTRVRQVLQEIKSVAQELRKEISERKNA